jgi:hypothetical protein
MVAVGDRWGGWHHDDWVFFTTCIGFIDRLVAGLAFDSAIFDFIAFVSCTDLMTAVDDRL